MNIHTDVYINLMNQADACQDRAGEISDIALRLRGQNRLDDDEYYQMIHESEDWQRRYVYLRDRAIAADRIYFAADITQAHDRTEQQKEETQLRNGG